jgi:hypothetical protein
MKKSFDVSILVFPFDEHTRMYCTLCIVQVNCVLYYTVTIMLKIILNVSINPDISIVIHVYEFTMREGRECRIWSWVSLLFRNKQKQLPKYIFYTATEKEDWTNSQPLLR